MNALVTFVPLPATYHFTPDLTGCPADFIGTFELEARLTNASAHTLTALVVHVTGLSPGTFLQNTTWRVLASRGGIEEDRKQRRIESTKGKNTCCRSLGYRRPSVRA
jgi:hypothetical protein